MIHGKGNTVTVTTDKTELTPGYIVAVFMLVCVIILTLLALYVAVRCL